MTGLYIFLAIVLLLFVLLLSPIRLSLRFDGSPHIAIRYLFLHFSLYPKEKKVRLSDYSPRKIRRRRKKATKKRLLAKQKAAVKTQKKKKRTLKQNLRLLRLILSILKEIYHDILGAVRIRIKHFRIRVSTEDAAKTAILYGAAAQSTAYLMEVLQRTTKTRINRHSVSVFADFCENESALDAHLVFSATPFRLCLLGIKAFFLFLVQKNTDKNKTGVENDERKQSQ